MNGHGAPTAPAGSPERSEAESKGSAPPGQARPDVKSGRLIGSLAGAGAIAGLVLVLAFEWADPKIKAHQAAVLAAAVGEVLGAPERTERLFVHQGKLTAELPAGVDSLKAERLYVGYDAGGKRVGYAITGAEPGFSDVISLIFGYDPLTRKVLGMKVLDNKETPGLGDKIVKDSSFVAEFSGAVTPLRGVKLGAGKNAPGEIDMITGVTISSRTVIGIINHRLERIGPLVEQHAREAAP